MTTCMVCERDVFDSLSVPYLSYYLPLAIARSHQCFPSRPLWDAFAQAFAGNEYENCCFPLILQNFTLIRNVNHRIAILRCS
jgi:hypothetical protein